MSMPDALTAGSHTRVRKVLRELGVPTPVLATTFGERRLGKEVHNFGDV
ncbi:MAG TPA: hypothetical protein VFO20_04820 [Propionibacteriaceae bacterium]|nr:hypothetical protein [Propionibacteriaceae bacterium]